MKKRSSLREAGRLTKKESLLLSEAGDACIRAYAPYSGLRIGAAVLAPGGKTYAGSNVENASYGLTVCAERAAVIDAVNDGERTFVLLAVTSPDLEELVPCGACLQFLAEFCDDLKILLKPKSGRVMTAKLSQLLPERFGK